MFEKKDEALKILLNLNIPRQFGYDIDNEDAANLEDIFYNSNVQFFHGCTKAVFTRPEWDFVVKIGFNGHWGQAEFYNEETDCYELEDEWDWIPYDARGEHTEDGDSEFYYSYMDEEYDTIMEVMDTAARDMVLETEYLATVNGFNAYIQEKAIPDESMGYDEISEPSINSRDYVDKHENNMPDSNWSALLIDHYGVEAFNAANELDAEMNLFRDMHCANYGYRANGTPVILDFGGFTDA